MSNLVDFGRHIDKPYTRVPVSYLLWMVNISHSRSDHAQEELTRRGTVLPDLDISGHALDRASLHCRKIWHEDRGPEEGLHAWLVRVAGEALETGEKKKDRYHWKGLKFVFEEDLSWPVLKTIMRGKSQ